MLVDGQGMNIVRALYDQDLPGLLDQSTVVPCGAPRPLGLRRSNGGLETAPTAAMTWGSLKSLYR